MFGRKQGPRISMVRNLVDSLVEHGRIKTTVIKAKELRRHVERAVTRGKSGSLHARRILLSKFPNPKTVEVLVGNLSVRFKDRPGGYTRIVRIGKRPGDNAEMAFIEFVDYKLPEAGEKKVVLSSKDKKKIEKRVIKKRKVHRKSQEKARRVARAHKK